MNSSICDITTETKVRGDINKEASDNIHIS